MSFDCIVFPQSGEPEKIQVHENNLAVRILVDGKLVSRRVGRFSVTEPGKETVYLFAHGMDHKPSNSVIKAAIVKLQPKPYAINS
ncbi:TPA: hypothetical protein ACPUVD_004187 [Klebsiella pneumoniae]|uniref:hypothetical protein n=1 Tax=Klebsiella pneumoniae TaxID=573 RepID=UPI0024AFD4F3|nr:hypothetical protein [Klebsiella pneumoniae]MDI7146350.1 hypothetical protein [Klebsiella pneumoniae]